MDDRQEFDEEQSWKDHIAVWRQAAENLSDLPRGKVYAEVADYLETGVKTW